MKKSHSIVIIGGGIIGTATAFYLSREGVDVCIVEQRGLASGTSGATMSNLSLHNRMPGTEWGLAMETWQTYKDLKDDLGYECEFDIVSSLMLIEKEEDIPWAEDRIKQQTKAGLEIELIGTEELIKRDPSVSPHLAGAAYCPSSAWVNSMLLCKAFAMAARQAGAKIYTGTGVTNILVEGGKVRGVDTSSGRVACEIVINAAGAEADAVGKLVDCHIPIRKNRGTIIVAQAPQSPMGIRAKSEGIDHAKIEREREAFIKAGTTGQPARDLELRYDVHFTRNQTKSGNLLIGRSGEDHQEDRVVKQEAINVILRRAVRFVPALSQTTIIRIFAGIRPYSPDLLPMLGPVDYPQGFVLACGFGDKGIGLGAAGARRVARAIVDTSYRIPYELSRQRFRQG